jgi:hypothetical protein
VRFRDVSVVLNSPLKDDEAPASSTIDIETPIYIRVFEAYDGQWKRGPTRRDRAVVANGDSRRVSKN